MILFSLKERKQKFTCKPQITWFLENNTALPKFLPGILH